MDRAPFEPVSEQRDRAVALSLMRMAIALLDRAGETMAAAYLQSAICDLDDTSLQNAEAG